MRIEAIYISPVKSLALQRLERADLLRDGIAGDRRFFLMSERGRLVTQRECGPLALLRARLSGDSRSLAVEFPDGRVVEDEPVPGEEVSVRFHGVRDVAGTVAAGPWGEALSAFAGMRVHLVRAASTAFDALPVSILSTGSVDALRAAADFGHIDERRFRPNFLLSGCAAHEEDGWTGGDVRLGASAVVRVIMRDPRCVITTHDPDTGERDFDTLGTIASYRTDQPKEVNFGVYAGVIEPGPVAVGDSLQPLARHHA